MSHSLVYILFIWTLMLILTNGQVNDTNGNVGFPNTTSNVTDPPGGGVPIYDQTTTASNSLGSYNLIDESNGYRTLLLADDFSIDQGCWRIDSIKLIGRIDVNDANYINSPGFEISIYNAIPNTTVPEEDPITTRDIPKADIIAVINPLGNGNDEVTLDFSDEPIYLEQGIYWMGNAIKGVFTSFPYWVWMRNTQQLGLYPAAIYTGTDWGCSTTWITRKECQGLGDNDQAWAMYGETFTDGCPVDCTTLNIDGYLDECSSLYDDLVSMMSALESDITDLNSSIVSNTEAITSLTRQVNLNTFNIMQFQNETDSLQRQITDNSINIRNIESEIEVLRLIDDDLQSQIIDLNETLDLCDCYDDIDGDESESSDDDDSSVDDIYGDDVVVDVYEDEGDVNSDSDSDDSDESKMMNNVENNDNINMDSVSFIQKKNEQIICALLLLNGLFMLAFCIGYSYFWIKVNDSYYKNLNYNSHSSANQCK